jgi:hypothetical protein
MGVLMYVVVNIRIRTSMNSMKMLFWQRLSDLDLALCWALKRINKYTASNIVSDKRASVA